MRIPSSIEVLGRRFSVAVVEVVEPKENLAGQIDYHKAAIRLDRDWDHSGQERLLLHESVHSIDRELDLNLSEENIRRFTVALWDLIKRNRLYFGLESSTKKARGKKP